MLKFYSLLLPIRIPSSSMRMNSSKFTGLKCRKHHVWALCLIFAISNSHPQEHLSPSAMLANYLSIHFSIVTVMKLIINYLVFFIIQRIVICVTGTIKHSREGCNNYSCVAATARPRRDAQCAACRRRAYSQLSQNSPTVRI